MKSRIISIIASTAAGFIIFGTAQAAQIGLRCKDTGKWLCAEGGGGSTLIANRSGMGAWETFSITDLNGGSLQSGDIVGLQSSHGNYLCAEGGGGSNAVANRWGLGGWEKFRIIRKAGPGTVQSNDEIHLQHESGYYVCAEGGGGGTVNVNRTSPGGWETFYVTVQNDPPSESIFGDINQDGIPDEIIRYGSHRFDMTLSEWTDCTNYWAVDYNGYWRASDLYYSASLANPNYEIVRPGETSGEWYTISFTPIWDVDEVAKAIAISNECYVYFSKELRFQADEGYDYILYEDPTGSGLLNPAVWVPVYSVSQWGNEVRTVGLGTYDAIDLDDRAYYLVKLGKPIVSIEVQLPWGTDPVVLPDWANMQVYNTAGLVSMRVRDTSGRTIYNDPRLRWVVVDAETGAVILDATGVEAADIVALGEGRSVKVTVSLPGTSFSVNFFLDIVSGEVRPGAGGAPANKIRKPDNNYVYQQERVSSCTIGALRNAIHLNGKTPPTEDEIIVMLGTMGKNPIDFELPIGTDGAGMSVGGATTEARYDAVLAPLGLEAVHLQNTTQAQFEAALRSGAVLIVGTETISVNPDGNSPPNAPHAVVMRMVGDKVEVIDSATGKVKKFPMADALKVPIFNGTPPKTGDIQQIKPKTP